MYYSIHGLKSRTKSALSADTARETNKGKTMNKYNEIEIQTAENLLKNGFKWLARNEYGYVSALTEKPQKDGYWSCSDNGKVEFISGKFTQIYQSIKWEDNEPTSLESIVHPQILDDAERKYLSAVIKPFRDRVKYIKKVFVNVECKSNYYIFIHFNDASNDMEFPIFGEKDMYKGMKIYNKYTLEELGL